MHPTRMIAWAALTAFAIWALALGIIAVGVWVKHPINGIVAYLVSAALIAVGAFTVRPRKR